MTEHRAEVVVMSRNSTETSLRSFNSIRHYGLDITRAALSGGAPLAPYLQAFHVDLFLSRYEDDVQRALTAGTAAAPISTVPTTAPAIATRSARSVAPTERRRTGRSTRSIDTTAAAVASTVTAAKVKRGPTSRVRSSTITSGQCQRYSE